MYADSFVNHNDERVINRRKPRVGDIRYISVVPETQQIDPFFILVEVLSCKDNVNLYEVCAVAGDRTCLWITGDHLYEKVDSRWVNR